MSLRMLENEELAAIAASVFDALEREIEQALPDGTQQEHNLAASMLLRMIQMGCAEALKDGGDGEA